MKKMETSLTLQSLNSAKSLIEKANISQLKEIIGRAEALRIYAAQEKDLPHITQNKSILH